MDAVLCRTSGSSPMRGRSRILTSEGQMLSERGVQGAEQGAEQGVTKPGLTHKSGPGWVQNL